MACLIRHPAEFSLYASVLKPSFFSGVQATLTARCILDYQAERLRFPQFVVLRELVAVAARGITDNEQNAALAVDYVNRLEQMETSDWAYVRDHVIVFAREAAVVTSMREAIALLKEGKIPPDGFSSMFSKAMEVGKNVDDLGYILHSDVDAVVDKVSSSDYGISSGYPLLDKAWRHGWGPGWLIVPLAPPKRYKTGFSINLAMNMVSPAIGENVFYYACEISQELAMVRALCHLAKQSTEMLYEAPARFKTLVKEAMTERIAGHLLFKSFASKSATIADIRAHAHSAISQLGIKPRVIVIDYAETIRAGDKNDPEYRQQSSVYTEARALGGELGCTIIMPDRCNRDTVGKAVPNMASFQGAFEKAGIVDGSIGLCATEEEHMNNTIRTFIFLNRHGPIFQHLRGRVDPETWRIELNEEIPYDPDADDEDKKEDRRRRRPRRSRGDDPAVDDEV